VVVDNGIDGEVVDLEAGGGVGAGVEHNHVCKRVTKTK
jgi:hypothetical protein